jgi:mannose-6-phosphate isomerase-like protein (cupin superfamily)
MTINKTIESGSARDQADDKWLQVTPGEWFRIRVSSAQTMGAYSIMEIVADPHNGVPLHIHNKEEEHFIVLDGTLDIAVGRRRWDVAAGSCVTVKRA